MTPLFFHTFNCAKVKHATADVADWMTDILPEDPPVLLTFGFQEAAPIIDGCFDHLDEFLDPFLGGVELALSETYGPRVYKEVGRHATGAIAIVSYGNPLSFTINKVVGAGTGVGYLRSSLKGGTGLLLDLSIGKFVFVTAHLTANEGYVVYRNQDFLNIVTMLDFGNGFGVYQPNTHFFFMGDLNYRVTRNPFGEVTEEIAGGSTTDGSTTERLLRVQDIDYKSIDELTIELEKGNTLYGLAEPEITFKPTFKFYPNQSGYNPKRLPSWCDRILYLPYGDADSQVVVHSYNAVFSYHGSDHRPVYLHISVPSTPPKFPLTGELTWTTASQGVVSLGLSPYLTVNKLAGYASDQTLGYAIYAATTNRGRVYLALALALLFIAYLIL